MRLRSGDKHHLRKSSDRKAQIRKAFVPLTGLICAFRSEDFLMWCLSPERNLTHNLFFQFPIVFGINSQNDWTGWQNGVNYDVFAQAPSLVSLVFSVVSLTIKLQLNEEICTLAKNLKPPCSPKVQPGAVKLVLCGHWMHLSYMHPVTSENQFRCTRLYTMQARKLVRIFQVFWPE